MAIRNMKPTTNGQRGMSRLVSSEITTNKPEKSLLEVKNKKAGRNNQGKITVRHQGGGEKRKYRKIDFKRNKFDIVGTVATIEYDPNRSANIALVNYADGEKRYIIAPKGLEVGMKVVSGTNVDIKVGNALPLMNIPEGTLCKRACPVQAISGAVGKPHQIDPNKCVKCGNCKNTCKFGAVSVRA